MGDKKDAWIAALVPGKSFMDIGGLWGTLNEKVSVALRAGAAHATMADIAPLDHSLWRDFDARCMQLGVNGYDKIQLDIVEPGPATSSLRADVVHCSGIIYHLPDPFRMLTNLRRLTGSHLVLTSMVVPETIRNQAGTLTFPPDTATFVPALTEATRAVVGEHFRNAGISIGAITQPLEEAWLWPDGSPNFGPWWWLMSPAFLRSLVESAGFVIEDECWSWEGHSYSYLVRHGEAARPA